MGTPYNQVQPTLTTKEITDQYVKQNFDTLNKYFSAQNQFLNFRFFEQVFSGSVSGFILAHGLGFTPQDIVLTKLIGPGAVTFNHGAFTTSNISLSTSGACRVRFYVGTYFNFQSSASATNSDSQTFYPSGSGITQLTGDITTPANSSGIASATLTSKGIARLGITAIPTGTILLYAGANFTPAGAFIPPSGYLVCDSSAVSRVLYPALFSVISTQYGVGDGATTFNLPDLRGRVVAGVDQAPVSGGAAAGRLSIAGSGINPGGLGNAAGLETITLSVAQMPAHAHSILGGTGGSTLPWNTAGGTAFCSLSSTSVTYQANSISGNPALQNTGGGGSHQNTQPMMLLNFIIKT